MHTSLVHQARQEKGQLREDNNNSYRCEEGEDKGDHPLEDPVQGYVLGYAGDDIGIQTYGRRNETGLHDHDHQHTEPDGIEAQSLDDGQKDGN